jgi:hypothetical protein
MSSLYLARLFVDALITIIVLVFCAGLIWLKR